jgi:hypothetical protein
LCLPVEDCAMGRRTTIHELGPDSGATRPEDCASTLFDLGLGTLQVDVCVRASSPELLSALRAGRRAGGFRQGQSRNGSHISRRAHIVCVRNPYRSRGGHQPRLTARAPTVPIPIFCRSCFGADSRIRRLFHSRRLDALSPSLPGAPTERWTRDHQAVRPSRISRVPEVSYDVRRPRVFGAEAAGLRERHPRRSTRIVDPASRQVREGVIRVASVSCMREMDRRRACRDGGKPTISPMPVDL